MPFPRKFQSLIEIELKDVEFPDYAWLAYAVCATEKDSCGWGGWIIDSVFKKTVKNYPTGTADKSLSANDAQICPQCGGEVYRTGAAIRFEPSLDQRPGLAFGVNYETVSIEWMDE